MSRCYIIAEVGLSHCGSLERALQSIEAFARAGANAIKWQDHRWQDVPSGQPHPSKHVNMTRAGWYASTMFRDDDWRKLREYCAAWNVDYICSPFSVEALREQVKLEPRYIKIASGEVTNRELVHAAWKCGVPLIFSFGMWKQGTDKFPWVHGMKYVAMSCTSEYPCVPEHSRLEVVEAGSAFSDHTTGTWFPVAAVALGATMIEKHVHLEDCAHSDRDIALTPAKFAEMVDGIRSVEKALYEASEPDLSAIRDVYLHKG